MARDVLEQVDDYLPDDPTKLGKLASTVQFRRLQLLLLRAIVLELRKLTQALAQREAPEP